MRSGSEWKDKSDKKGEVHLGRKVRKIEMEDKGDRKGKLEKIRDRKAGEKQMNWNTKERKRSDNKGKK